MSVPVDGRVPAIRRSPGITPRLSLNIDLPPRETSARDESGRQLLGADGFVGPVVTHVTAVTGEQS